MGKKKVEFNSIVIATFSAWKHGARTPTNGMIEPLLSFFGPKTHEIVLIDGPHPGSDDIIPKIETYKEGTLIKQTQPRFLFPPFFILKKFNRLATQPTFKIRDFTTVIQVLLSKRNPTDLFIGLESINTLAGIVFRKLGKVKTVVYYVSDYSPTRYPSRLVNSVYLWLDRFAAMHADFIWDVSRAIMPARIKAGLKKEKAAPLIHVRNALLPSQIRYLPIQKLEPYSLVFAGTIGPENGLDLAIEALALARKRLPRLTLHIVGGGLKEDEELAKRLIKKLRLEKCVVNHGFISDLNGLSDKLSHYMIGLAPYRAIPWSVRWYADATKMRLYFASGLPVITTQVPPLGKEAKAKDCAIVVEDTKEDLAEAIITMLSNSKTYTAYRQHAIAFARTNTWENTYKYALGKMGYL